MINHDTYNGQTHKGLLSRPQILAYALPVFSVSLLMGPLTVLQGMYAKYFGLSLTAIATTLLIARLFDAVSDPVIGYLSDRYMARNSSRKPFVLVGGILFVVSGWFLYVPPTAVSEVYFLVWFLIFYLAHTLFEIPHLAWGSELAVNSQGKNTLYGWRAVSTNLGVLVFFVMPLLPMFETNAFTPQTLKWSVLAAGCLVGPLLYVCIIKVPSQVRPNPEKSQESLRGALSSILGNFPLLVFLSAFLCAGVGVGMWFSLVFLFVDSFLGLGEDFAVVYAISYGISTLTLAGWPKLANRWGKQPVWALGMLAIVIGLMGTGLLTPGETTQVSLLFCMAAISSGFAAVGIMAPSLLADIIDYGTWKFGQDQAGTYFSLFTLMSKANVAVGGAVGLAIAAWYGFDATATSHSAEVAFGLHLAMAWLPVPLVLLSIVFIMLIPINARRHAIIRRHLDTRLDRAKANLKQNLPNNPRMLMQLKEATNV